MLKVEVSERISRGDPRYEKITKSARTVLHVAALEAGSAEMGERTSEMIAILNAALMIAFVNGIKHDHRLKAFEDMVATMRATVEHSLKRADKGTPD